MTIRRRAPNDSPEIVIIRERCLSNLPARFPLLEPHGVHGNVPADQHDRGARGAEHHGSSLGLRREGNGRRGGQIATLRA